MGFGPGNGGASEHRNVPVLQVRVSLAILPGASFLIEAYEDFSFSTAKGENLAGSCQTIFYRLDAMYSQLTILPTV
jgi:hypothetical protein